MNERDPGQPTMPWWTTPAGISIGFLLPILGLIAYIGEADHPGLTIRGLRFLGPGYLALGALLLIVMALAGWVGQQIRLPAGTVQPSDLPGWDIAALAVGTVALVAYAIWFRDYWIDPSLLVRTLMGEHRPDRSNIELTPGLTSLANVAPAFFSIYAYRVAFAGPRLDRRMHGLCALLIVLTAFRVYAWSERLALIEAAVPFGLVLGAVAIASPKRSIRALIWGGPFVALPGLVAYFGLAEYVRSWTAATYSGKLPFWDFAIGRIASYYYTSLNNGAGLLETLDWPTYTFEHTLFWLHRAPLSVGPMFSAYVDLTQFQPDSFLEKFADPEFNNPSGLYAVLCDLGLPLGIGYFAAVAAAGGLLLQAYRERMLIGVLLYPMLFLSFLEVFRYPYLGQPRAFSWAIGIVLALLIVRMRHAPRSGSDGAHAALPSR